jgi:hypothetical protein
MIAERPLPNPPGLEFDFPIGVEPIVVLFDTAAPSVALIDPEQGETRRFFELDAAALFGPDLEPNAAPLLDLRPAGRDELLLLTERCITEQEWMRSCLHRLRSSTPLLTWTQATASEAETPPTFEIETLGPLGPYLALAIASEGGRAVWTTWVDDSELWLWSADLRGQSRMQPRRVDADALVDTSPRISADGRIVISEVSLALDELGSISVARAFVLPPVAEQ